MKSPDMPLADDGIGLHEEIEEYLAGYEQGENGSVPVRADTSLRDGPELWRPRKGDKPPKDGPLTLPQVIDYCEAQAKKWQKQARADDFKEMKCCHAYSLLAQQAKHNAELLRRVKPAPSVSSDKAAATKEVLNTLLSAIPVDAKAISTADAVRSLVPVFPDLFDGAMSLKGAGKRLQGLLQGLGVFTCNVRSNGKVVKGYRVADLQKTAV